MDLGGSSTSLDTILSIGVPGYTAPIFTDSLWCLAIGDTSHLWSPVSAERKCWHCEASGSESPSQLVSACATASCCGPICRDHASTCRLPAAQPPATLVGFNPCMWWAILGFSLWSKHRRSRCHVGKHCRAVSCQLTSMQSLAASSRNHRLANRQCYADR